MLPPRTIAGVLAAFGILFVGHWGLTAEKKEARVTQIVKDVRLLASKTGARRATVNEPVPEGVAVRTGTESRAELTFTDQTLTRLGANTIFSYAQGARQFDLGSGAVMLCVPKRAGAAVIRTAAATAAVTGGIAMAETHSKTWTKFIVMEGEACIEPIREHHRRQKSPTPGENCIKLYAGQMLVISPTGRWTSPRNIDLRKLKDTSGNVNGFGAPLPKWVLNLIDTEIENQKGNPPGGGYVDPTGIDPRDQRAAGEPPPSPPIHQGPPPGS